MTALWLGPARCQACHYLVEFRSDGHWHDVDDGAIHSCGEFRPRRRSWLEQLRDRLALRRSHAPETV